LTLSVRIVPPGGIHCVNTYEDNISVGLHFLYFIQLWQCFLVKLGESLNRALTNTWHEDIIDRLDAILFHHVKELRRLEANGKSILLKQCNIA